jgi:hypothetical protein
MNNSTTLAQTRNTPSTAVVNAGFFDLQGFELMQRVAKAFSSSSLVPAQYQNNLPNCMIAMDMAQRIGANPLMVMQNLYIVHGTPGWSSKFLIATINVCGRFNALRYEWKGQPGEDSYGCRAWTIEKSTGERLDGIWVTWAMVNAEGWASKNGSKWKTMPDQMFIYRAAAFWQRAYAPELGMGLQTVEELHDIIDAGTSSDGTIQVDVEALRAANGEQPKRNRPDEKATDVEFKQTEQNVNQDTGEVTDTSTDLAQAEAGKPAQGAASAVPASTGDPLPIYHDVAKALRDAKTLDGLDLAADLIRDVEDDNERSDLEHIYGQRRAEIETPATKPVRRASNVSME